MKTAWKGALLHILAWAALGYVVLHPAAMLIEAVSAKTGLGALRSLARAFSGEHHLMSACFVLFGAGLGLAHWFYVRRLTRRAAPPGGGASEPLCPACAPAAAAKTPPPVRWSVRLSQETGTWLSRGACARCGRQLYGARRREVGSE
ncbi:MAG: hypothetical protein HY926_00315 [Elusimicrobia bacterium]|nr:hypothetical protein [Elusimicrobiota bacterium]